MPPTSVISRRRAQRAVRQLLPALAVLSAAACGGGGDNVTGTGGASTTTFSVQASFVLAPTTTSGLALRVTPVYELAAGGTKALGATSKDLTSTSAQTVPVTVDITACLADPARAGATTTGSGSCRVQVEFALLSGGRVVDAQTFGTYTVINGGPANVQSVTFSEVTGVRVKDAAGGVVANGGAVRAVVNSALTLSAEVVRADNATVNRAVAWSSDNTAVAAVNASTGAVTPVAPGTAKITAAVNGVSSSVVVTVVPAPAAVAVTVAPGGGGSGTVTSTPAGLNCRVQAGTATSTSVCSTPIASDQQLVLTAAPDAGSTFAGWGGDCAGAGTAAQCTLPASGGAARNVTVRFNAQRTLTVTPAGTGVGRVTSNAGGISCSVGDAANCNAAYVDGATVTLTATPDANSTFAGWGGACTGTGACQVTMDRDQAVTATFNARPNPVPFNVYVLSSSGAEYRTDLVYSLVNNGTPVSTFGRITTVLSSAGAQPSSSGQFSADLGSRVTLTFRPGTSQPGPNGPGRIASLGGVCAGTPIDANGVATCTFTQTANARVDINLAP